MRSTCSVARLLLKGGREGRGWGRLSLAGGACVALLSSSLELYVQYCTILNLSATRDFEQLVEQPPRLELGKSNLEKFTPMSDFLKTKLSWDTLRALRVTW